jgi:hypothetical protein
LEPLNDKYEYGKKKMEEENKHKMKEERKRLWHIIKINVNSLRN